MKFLICGIVLVFNVGCISSKEVMRKGLDSFTGQPIQAAIDVFGLPDGKMPLTDSQVYVWGNRSLGTYTYNKTPYIYENKCEIKLLCDSSDKIKTWEYRGNTDGCMPFAESLLEYLKTSCGKLCQKLADGGQLGNEETVDKCNSDCLANPQQYDWNKINTH